MHLKAKKYIEKLNLSPHPEGGYFKEAYRSPEIIKNENLPGRYTGDRNFSTSIYFLLEGENISHFHKLKSDETWHFYDGSPAKIYILSGEGILTEKIIGLNIENGEVPQVLIEKDNWFAAEVIDKDSFILAGCTVSPGFDFSDFKMAEREALLKSFPGQSELIKRLTLTN